MQSAAKRAKLDRSLPQIVCFVAAAWHKPPLAVPKKAHFTRKMPPRTTAAYDMIRPIATKT